jgi:hypothetical protein
MTLSARTVAIWFLAIAATQSGSQAREATHTSPQLREYKRQVSEILGNAWVQRILRHQREVIVGTVHVTFYIMPSGAPQDIRIEAKAQDRVQAALLRDMMNKISFPRPPLSVLRECRDRRLPADFYFTLYDRHP